MMVLLFGGGSVNPASANIFLNGNFSGGSLGWVGEGSVEYQGGYARLSDENGATLTRTMQLVAFLGEGTLSFEFLADLSSAVPVGTSPDTAFVSLYTVDDPTVFDVDTGAFADARGLLQIDREGVQVLEGSLSAGTLGPRWQTFSVEMESTNSYIVPVVELFGANEVDADSAIQVDNFLIRVDRSALRPVVTSIRIRWLQGQVRLTFEDPKGREDSFRIESTPTVADPSSWSLVPSAVVHCPAPGHFEADLPLPADPTQASHFFRVNPR